MIQQAAQQPQQQSADILLAMAEQSKADAMVMREQRQAQKDANDAAAKNTEIQIDAFNAETGRIDTQIKAAKADAEIKLKQFDQFNKRVQSAAKIQGDLVSRLRPSLTEANR